jgi:DNA polymerase-1
MNEDGEHVGGMVGFLKSVGAAIRQFKPERCIIVFDGKGGSASRRKLYPEYKENRKTSIKLNRAYGANELNQEEESMKVQLIKLIEILELLPIQVVSIDNIEADDTIGYLAALAQQQGNSVTIMSTDKDFLQLVNDKVHVWNPVKKRYYDAAGVLLDYGIHPTNFLIYRVLDGDKSDNINGVKGSGLKTLTKYFPELKEETKLLFEDIYTKCIDVKGKPRSELCKKILASKDIIERNSKLMTLVDMHIDGSSRSVIRNKFNSAIPQLNKLELTLRLKRDKLLSAFPNLDEWTRNTFISLNRYAILQGNKNEHG